MQVTKAKTLGTAKLPYEWRDGDSLISEDRALLDFNVIHGFLSRSYWSEGIPRGVLHRAIENSIPFGVYVSGKQVGFARIITDRATFAYVADVFILEPYRGRGLGVRLMEAIRAHPGLQNLRRWHLVTRDAQGLYQKTGFSPLQDPTMHMEIFVRDIYQRA